MSTTIRRVAILLAALAAAATVPFGASTANASTSQHGSQPAGTYYDLLRGSQPGVTYYDA